MNATSLYVSTCRLVLQANAEDSSSWTDLYRLVPYLRQSLSCTVCGNLLIEPYTPTETNCQHHVCRSCKGGRKKLKPSCSWCKNYDKYIENVQLRILLQCYKKLCKYMTSTAIFKNLIIARTNPSSNSSMILDGSPNLLNLIQEGSGFIDEFQTSCGISKNSFNLLSNIFTTSTSTQTSLIPSSDTPLDSGRLEVERDSQNINSPLQNGTPLYSVMHTGNRLTFKRKASESENDNPDLSSAEVASQENTHPLNTINSNNTQRTPGRRSKLQQNPATLSKIGCRCGAATQTPGKLTCGGQRCACYSENKPCMDCKCRGCRNPHTADGQKVRPAIVGLEDNQQITSNENGTETENGIEPSHSKDVKDTNNIDATPPSVPETE